MEHKMIIQRLDSTRYNDGIKTKYPAESFKGVSFDGIPMILSKEKNVKHPSMNDVQNDTLSRDYEVVGYITDSKLVEAGTPRIEGMVDIANNELSAGITAGKYAISSGFTAKTTPTEYGQCITGEIKPNHVLIFPVENASPNDGMAAFLNLCDCENMNNILNTDKTEKNNNLKTMTETTDKTIENVAELTAALSAKDTEINNLQNELKELKVYIEKVENDRQWTEISNLLPDALKNSRELYDTNTKAFVKELLNIMNRQVSIPKAEGKVTELSNTAAELDEVCGYKVVFG